jgi:glutamine amidotransferase
MITILKYESGNISSIQNMLNYLGYYDVVHSNDHEDLIKSDAIILPGVGNFDYAIENLHKANIFKIIKDLVQDKKKLFLGICLGMQLIFNKSEEGKLNGLNLIDADICSFNSLDKKIIGNLKVPHIGWNNIKVKNDNLLLSNIKQENRFYFAHSYYLKLKQKEISIGETMYGLNFTSAINLDNIYGVQFHPEKSLNDGKTIFKNFIQLIYARKKNYSNFTT